MYETVKHIYKNALKCKNSINAEEFNLERSAPAAQKQMALFNKICLVLILLIWKMGSQILVKNIRCHPKYPSHEQLISVFSWKSPGQPLWLSY